VQQNFYESGQGRIQKFVLKFFLYGREDLEEGVWDFFLKNPSKLKKIHKKGFLTPKALSEYTPESGIFTKFFSDSSVPPNIRNGNCCLRNTSLNPTLLPAHFQYSKELGELFDTPNHTTEVSKLTVKIFKFFITVTKNQKIQ